MSGEPKVVDALLPWDWSGAPRSFARRKSQLVSPGGTQALDGQFVRPWPRVRDAPLGVPVAVSEGHRDLQGAVITFAQTLLSIAVAVFSVCTMLAVGLGHTLRDVFGPMLDSRGVVRALLANFVLVPLVAYGVVRLVPLDESYATGLMLIATAAGAPFLIKLTAVANGNVPLSASLTMLLLPITVLYMPVAVPMLAPEARVSPAAIALPLLWTMILPLCAGLLVRARREVLAERLRPWLGTLASLSLVVLVAATVLTNLGGIIRFINTGAIFAPLVLILVAYVIGWVFGREYRGGHVVLGLGTAQRNMAAAMVVATEGLDDRNTVVMVVVASLVELAVLFPIAWFLSRRGRRNRRLRHADVARAGA